MQKLKSIGQRIGGIAHDFNNMLAVVIGSLEMAANAWPMMSTRSAPTSAIPCTMKLASTT